MDMKGMKKMEGMDHKQTYSIMDGMHNGWGMGYGYGWMIGFVVLVIVILLAVKLMNKTTIQNLPNNSSPDVLREGYAHCFLPE